jgi:hypothetical protein
VKTTQTACPPSASARPAHPNPTLLGAPRLDARAQAALQQQAAHPGVVRVLALVARQRPQPRMRRALRRPAPPLARLLRAHVEQAALGDERTPALALRQALVVDGNQAQLRLALLLRAAPRPPVTILVAVCAQLVWSGVSARPGSSGMGAAGRPAVRPAQTRARPRASPRRRRTRAQTRRASRGTPSAPAGSPAPAPRGGARRGARPSCGARRAAAPPAAPGALDGADMRGAAQGRRMLSTGCGADGCGPGPGVPSVLGSGTIARVRGRRVRRPAPAATLTALSCRVGKSTLPYSCEVGSSDPNPITQRGRRRLRRALWAERGPP